MGCGGDVNVMDVTPLSGHSRQRGEVRKTEQREIRSHLRSIDVG